MNTYLRSLADHGPNINDTTDVIVHELANGHVFSQSFRGNLALWTINGELVGKFSLAKEEIESCIPIFGSHILLGTSSEKLFLWTDPGGSIQQLSPNKCNGIFNLSDERFATWDLDGTLYLWNNQFQIYSVLKGHTRWIEGLLKLSNGRLLSWSRDTKLCLWDVQGKLLKTMAGHTKDVVGAIELHDGSIFSWAEDDTLIFWDKDGVQLKLVPNRAAVLGALLLPNSNILCWTAKGILQIWSPSGNLIRELIGHTQYVHGVLILHDRRLLSWSDDATLRIWNESGESLILEGHTDQVHYANVIQNKYIISRSNTDATYDNSIRLWDLSGKMLDIIEFDRHISSLIVLKDEKTIVIGHTSGGHIKFFRLTN